MTDRRDHSNILLDFYGALLTEKQQDVYRMYFEEDFTMPEIAEMQGTSSQSVSDILKRTDAKLTEYNNKLRLIERYQEYRYGGALIKQELNKIYEGIVGNDPRISVLKIRSILEQLNM